jgi:hypothetical protein
MESLREIGYDLPSALADIVDNSIEANAKSIDIRFAFDGADSWVLIADDGVGMTGSTLGEAMRYGTERAYEVGELGRFGLGLKTASLSQCRRLTVASRHGRERRRIEIRQWDLDHVAVSNRWEVLRLDTKSVPAALVDPLLRRRGTVVLWEGLDRVLDYRLPSGAAARNGFAALADGVAAHLAMVFHRYLAGEVRGKRRVTIFVNGGQIDAWDPYARSEPNTRVLTAQVMTLKGGTGARRMVVRPYVLPTQERFSSAAAHARASGPQRWNRQQGFYFYRNDRLIQAGGWSRLRTVDEHTKLARIAVDLPAGCDELFRVNVAKMRVSIPPSVREPLMAIASGVASEAGATYRRPGSSVRRPSSGGEDVAAAAPALLVASLTIHERDLLGTVVNVARDEFREEPDIVRRLLSRIDRCPAEPALSGKDATAPSRVLIFEP